MKLILLLSLLAIGITAATLNARSCKLKEGDTAPSFQAQDDTGKTITFPSDHQGLKALVFYPMASTPGCTKEMCSLSKGYNDLKSNGITVIGISPSSVSHQAKFKKAHDFKFPLLSSTDEISKLYGVDGLFWIDRHTFLIDKNNKIVSVITHVDKKNAAQQIIDGFKLKK